MFGILEDSILSRQPSIDTHTHTHTRVAKQRRAHTDKNVPIYTAEATFHLRV